MGSNRLKRRRHAPQSAREGRTGQQARTASQVRPEDFSAPAALGETRRRHSFVSVPLRWPPSGRSAHGLAQGRQEIGPQRQDYPTYATAYSCDMVGAGRGEPVAGGRQSGDDGQDVGSDLWSSPSGLAKRGGRSVICAVAHFRRKLYNSVKPRYLPGEDTALAEVCCLSAVIVTENREQGKNVGP